MITVEQHTKDNELAKSRKQPTMMTLDEIAEELRISYGTARKLATEGKFPFCRQVGSQWRGDRVAFREWLKPTQPKGTQ